MTWTQLTDLLPELSNSAGKVAGICQTVVGKTFLCVPGVITALPGQLLQTRTHAKTKKLMKKKQRNEISQFEF